jgi:hypothetical protein
MQLWKKKVNNRPTPNTGIYLPHTSKRSALDPKPGPGWYDFIFERFEYKGKNFWQCFTHSIGELDMVGMVKHGVQPPL